MKNRIDALLTGLRLYADEAIDMTGAALGGSWGGNTSLNYRKWLVGWICGLSALLLDVPNPLDPNPLDPITPTFGTGSHDHPATA